MWHCSLLLLTAMLLCTVAAGQSIYLYSAGPQQKICCIGRQLGQTDTVLIDWVVVLCPPTHTRLTALFRDYQRWAGTRKVKPIWILLKQDSEWQWHQLGHMQVCTSLQTDNHASTPPLSFLQAGCPSCHPTNSVKALNSTQNRSFQRCFPKPMSRLGMVKN